MSASHDIQALCVGAMAVSPTQFLTIVTGSGNEGMLEIRPREDLPQFEVPTWKAQLAFFKQDDTIPFEKANEHLKTFDEVEWSDVKFLAPNEAEIHGTSGQLRLRLSTPFSGA